MSRRSVPALALLFIVTGVVSLLVQFPLALALHLANVPLSAREVSGTIWKGNIRGAVVEGYALGDIAVSGRLLPILRGKVVTVVDIEGAVANGAATVELGFSSLTFRDTAFVLNVEPFNLVDAFGAPMTGRVDVDTEYFSLGSEGCLRGEVGVQTDTLQRSAERYGGEGFALEGEGACDDGRFILPLNGEGAEGQAEARIEVVGQTYTTEFNVIPEYPQLSGALIAAGFQQFGTRYTLVQRGELF